MKKILLVEDDVFVRDIYQTKFVQEGFEVTAAENGKQALDILASFTPDIILLDVSMPFVTGIEVLRELKKNPSWKDIPVIMLTNLSERDVISQTSDIGADEYLIKSHFTPSEVVRKVRAVLGEGEEQSN
ncbi:MAG TPA: response regulator [Candidatus Moranbacteria bacterium]|nr:response regulator [Candidatus Moranbacteria bacterium]